MNTFRGTAVTEDMDWSIGTSRAKFEANWLAKSSALPSAAKVISQNIAQFSFKLFFFSKNDTVQPSKEQ